MQQPTTARLGVLFLTVLGGLASYVFVPLPGDAQTMINVNVLFDEEDDDLTDGMCLTASGACTLRAALQHANFTGGNFIISLSIGTYAITISGGGENTCVAGDLDIFSANVTLQGSPFGPTVIDGNGLDRCLDIFEGVTVHLENLIFRGGDPGIGSPPGTTSANGGGLRIGGLGANPPTVTMTSVVVEANLADLPGGSVTHGGGIYNAGSLTLTGCSVRQNDAKSNGGGVHTAAGGTTTIIGGSYQQNTANRGGGISNGGTTSLDQVLVCLNTSIAAGGGVRNTGAISIFDSTIELNSAGTPAAASFGGGLENTGGADLVDTTIRANAVTGEGGGVSNSTLASLDLSRVTISGNTSSTDGAGMLALGTVTATNCTISENSAQGVGGGVKSDSPPASGSPSLVFLRNVTIAFNNAAGAGGIQADVFPPGIFELRNSILSDNVPFNYAGLPPITAAGVVLDSDGTLGLLPPHVSGVSAMLGPLQNNGGATETHELLPGSPAIDAGSPADCATTAGPLLEDQRTAPRPEDGDGNGVPVCDLGAYEAPAAPGCVAGNWNLVPTPIHPSARGEIDLAFDSARGKTVLFGDPGGMTDTWEYDGAWQQVASSGPGSRWDHSMAFDSARGVTVLFGGRNNFGLFLSDVWEWDGTAWVAVTTATSPPARHSAAMTYDSARGVVVLFGGRDFANFYGDTWEYDGLDWTQRFPANNPSGRETPAMDFDSNRAVTVLYGGSAGIVQQDTWEWDGNNWLLRVAVSPPGPKTDHGVAYDPSGLRTLVYGGVFSGDEVWGWDGTAWTLAGSGGPGGRTSTGFVHDSARQVTVMFGGYPNATGLPGDDTWEFGCPSLDLFIRGDCEGNLQPNIGDPIRILGYLFPTGPPLTLDCQDACDGNDDGSIDIGDAIFMLTYLFLQGNPPPPPFPGCGSDPTAADPLRCSLHPC